MKRVFLVIMAFMILLSAACLAEEETGSARSLIDIYDALISETNEATGGKAVIEDAAGLLSDDEVVAVMKAMKPITDYCHVGFITYPADGPSTYSSVSKAKLWGKLVFHDKYRYAIFIIDVKARYLAICTNWDSDSLSSERIDAITEEVHLFATNGEYGTCACETFDRVLETLASEKE